MADITISASDVLQSVGTQMTRGISGEAIVAGETIYKNADGKYYKADGNDATKLPVVGVAVNSAPAAGQPFNFVTSDINLTIGAHAAGTGIPLFQSATPGKICSLADVTTGNLTTCIGVTNNSTKLTFGVVGGNGTHA